MNGLFARWVVVAKANSPSELGRVAPTIKEAPPGTPGRVKVEGLGIGARVFDLALAEQMFGSRLVPEGARVIDCHEENNIGYVEFEVTGTPIIPLLIAIAAALVALGILTALITISLKISEIPPILFSWQMVLVIAIAIVAVIVIIVLVARKGRIAAGPVVVGK